MWERFQTFLRQFNAQTLAFYGSLTTGRKISLFVLLGSVFLGLLMLSLWRPQIKYESAFSNLSIEDKRDILAHLKKNKIEDFKLEGDSLLFPEEKSAQYRMDLAQEGLPSAGIGVGWEKFDEQNLAMTDFNQRINRVRAIQGELSRTINKLELVESSRVHVVMPEAAVFAEDKKPTTASISLRLKRGKTLSQKQIQGILHLVAHAVEGLQPQNISIVDQDGNLISKPQENDDGLDAITTSQREYKRKYEKEMESKIKEILGRVVGEDKVIAKVDATLDFTKIERTVQDVDPDRTVMISQNRSENESSGMGLNPTGVPGAKSNLPGEAQDVSAGGGSQQKNKQATETSNFEVKRTTSRIVEPLGSLKKMTASVLVDGKTVDSKWTARTTEEMATITKLVKNAIGFQDDRDALTVENAQFEADAFAKAEQNTIQERKSQLMQTGIWGGVTALIVILFFMAVVRPYFKWLTYDPEKRSPQELIIQDLELERSGEVSKKVQVQEDLPFEKLPPKEQVLYIARHDPKRATEALRQLLSPHHG